MTENVDVYQDFEDFVASLARSSKEVQVSSIDDELEPEELAPINDPHAQITAQMDYEEWQWKKQLTQLRVEREAAIRRGEIDRDASDYFSGATEDDLDNTSFWLGGL